MNGRARFLGLVALAWGGVLMPAAQAANLVANGDFASGNSGFDSAYVYVTPDAPIDGGNGPWHGGLYTVTAPGAVGGATSWGGGWNAPATGAAGVLLVNGASTDYAATTAPGSVVWTETVSVLPNTSYVFSFDAVDVDGGPYAVLLPSINGTEGASLNANQSWQQATMDWNSGSSTTAVLRLADTDNAEGNNDFALTGISLSSAVPEPGGACLVLAGLAMLATVSVRRRAMV
jgi:hypothetical protein